MFNLYCPSCQDVRAMKMKDDGLKCVTCCKVIMENDLDTLSMTLYHEKMDIERRLRMIKTSLPVFTALYNVSRAKERKAKEDQRNNGIPPKGWGTIATPAPDEML